MKVLIDREFESLLPRLSAEERSALSVKLQLDGCTEPLPYWVPDGGKFGLLLDGHHRREICLAEKIPFSYRELKFSDRAAAIEWIIENQLGRRNLTADQVRYYRGREYLSKKQAEPGQRVLPDAQNAHPNGAAEKPGKTIAQVLGEKHGVNQATIRRDAEFAQAVDTLPPAEKQKVLSGQSGKSRSQVIKDALPEPKKEQPKVGAAQFDKKVFENCWGQLYRQIDTVGNAYKCKETPAAENLRRQLVDFKTAFLAWAEEARKAAS